MSIEGQTSGNFVERRQFPRVAITIPVKLSRGAAPPVTGLTHDVSPGGMQVRLSAKAAAMLMPKGEKTQRDGKSRLQAQFLVPLRGKRYAISVQCVAAHVSALEGASAVAQVAIGFRFKHFKDAKTQQRFVRFIEEQLVPVEDYDLYLRGRTPPQDEASLEGDGPL
jgi:c-di-GMP-binding flagellar brake protein YcgR